MCKNCTIKKTSQKRNKKRIRLYDQGTPRLTMLQGRFIRSLEKYFKAQRNYRADYVDTLPELQNINKEIEFKKILVKKSTTESQAKILLAFSEGMISGAMTEGVKEFTSEVPKNRQFKAGFGIKSDTVKEYAKTRAGELITGLDETTKKRVMFLIGESISNGDSQADLKKKLLANFTFSKYRAGLIASTELGTAYLEGKKRSFEETMDYYGIPYSNGWKMVQIHDDDRTCPTCQACQPDVGKRVRYDQPFSNGLMFAIFHVGCRCNTTFSMFNPDDPLLDRPQNRPKQEAPKPKPVDEATKPTTIEQANKYVEDLFIMPPNFKGLKADEASIASVAIREMFNKMKFLDRIPKLGINSRNARAHVTHNRRTSVTMELGISKKSFRQTKYEQTYVERIADTKEKLLKRAEGYYAKADNGEGEYWRSYGKQAEREAKKLDNSADVWTIGMEKADDRATVIYHEFWHVLDNFVTSKAKADQVAGSYNSDMRKLYTDKVRLFSQFRSDLRLKKNTLSDYGITNDAEVFAESWSAYVEGEYHRITPAIKDWFDNALDFLHSKYAS